jgi:GTP-binding protein
LETNNRVGASERKAARKARRTPGEWAEFDDADGAGESDEE